MIKISAIILFVFSTVAVLAQTNTINTEKASKLSFAVNLGGTLTSVPDAKHTLIVLPEGVIIPNYIHPSNGTTYIVTESKASSKSKRKLKPKIKT